MTLKAVFRTLAVLGGVALGLPQASAAADHRTDFGPLIVAALDDHILPRHEAFAAGAAHLSRVASGFCAGTASLADVRAAYQQAMDGWMGLQHLAFGPIQSFNRRHRIQFWPDKRNAGPEQVDKVLAEQPRDIFKPNGFTFASVAIQGLPVVERLAFAGEAPSGYACELMAAVSGNIDAIAEEMVKGWRDGGESWGADMRDAAAGGSDMLGNPDEVAGMLLGGFSGELKLIREYKLQDPLAGGIAESPHAGRSLRNIVVNLDALVELYDATFLPPLREADPKLAVLLERAFAQTRATAASLPASMAEALADPTHREALDKLATEAGALRQLAAERAADRLGLVLGFNALDGD